MPRQKKYPVTVVDHGDMCVIIWEEDEGLSTIKSCLRRGERVEVYTEMMTEKQYDALDDYEGEC